MTAQTGLFLVLAIAVLWFGSRLAIGGRGSTRGRLAAMFRREKPVIAAGLGPDALQTMIGDIEMLVQRNSALRGAILAGRFAAGLGRPDDPAIFILLARDPQAFSGRDWLGGWPYIARGHLVQNHDIVPEDGGIVHRFSLRGAPPIECHVVAEDLAEPLLASRPFLAEGAKLLASTTGAGSKVLARWRATITTGETT